MVAPNTKLNDGSECQNEDTALNAKLKKMVAEMPNWRHGSKHLKLMEMALNGKNDLEC